MASSPGAVARARNVGADAAVAGENSGAWSAGLGWWLDVVALVAWKLRTYH